MSSSVPSYEQFKATTPFLPSLGIHVIEGDIPLRSEEALRGYYLKNIRKGTALTVSTSGACQARWDDSRRMSLTYCVSSSFGAHHATVVNAMRAAAADWESAAQVHFEYLSAESDSCDQYNNRVVFNVTPATLDPRFVAMAFFPGEARINRQILVDSRSFTDGWPVAGILRHELGHVLGFRHEHIRPEANPSSTCQEASNWAPLTVYDNASIMHYTSCGGISAGGLSDKDKEGAQRLYSNGLCAVQSYGRGVGRTPTDCGGGDLQGGLCYPSCQDGYYGVGPVCWERCPDGYADDGAFCRRNAEIIGADNSRCPWYDRCGLTLAKGCSRCPDGYRNDGCTCRIDAHIFAKNSYGRGTGTVPSCSSGDQMDGGLCYPACTPGTNPVGPMCWSCGCAAGGLTN